LKKSKRLMKMEMNFEEQENFLKF